MDKGLTVLILWPEIPSPKIYQPNSSAQAQTFGISLKKGASSGLHCNPLQGNYRVELLHREISVFITGNEFTEYSFLLFWLHFFPVLITLKLLL